MLFALCFVIPLKAQTMRQLLAAMPDSILEIYTHNDKLDFIDFIDNNMKAEVKSKFGTKTEMTSLTDDFCRIKTSEVSTIDIKVLNGGNLICIINSVKSTAWDSDLRFFDKEWKELPASSHFTMPTTEEFIPRLDGMTDEQYQALVNKAETPFFHAEFGAGNQVKVTYTSSAITADNYEKEIKPYIHSEVVAMIR